jgi:hypothetical protein
VTVSERIERPFLRLSPGLFFPQDLPGAGKFSEETLKASTTTAF